MGTRQTGDGVVQRPTIRSGTNTSNGVVRRLTDRDRWNSIRNRRMVEPVLEAPARLPSHSNLTCVDETKGVFPCYNDLVKTPLEAENLRLTPGLTPSSRLDLTTTCPPSPTQPPRPRVPLGCPLTLPAAF